MDVQFNNPKLTMLDPCFYRIIVQGCLDASWSNRLAGLNITVTEISEDCSVTQLSGQVLDQAALLGVLNALYNMHYPLISVKQQEKKEEQV